MPESSLSDRCYRWLLRVLPADFREEFSSDMEETFRAQRDETERRRGIRALAGMWWATIIDILRMAPREHWHVLAQDMRYALRMMRKNPGYAAAAVLILGLGIGVNTGIFSVLNSVLLQPLPYLQGNRLVVLKQRQPRAGEDNMLFTPPEIEDYRRQNKTLSGLVEYHSMTFTLYGGDEAHRVKTGVVSAGFFDFFGVTPLLGRSFVADDDRPGAPPVLMLSYEFWQQVEHGNPNVVGKKYQMNDRPHVVIGVLPPIPQYPRDNDVYMTTTSCPFRSNPKNIASRTAFRAMRLFGRLKPQATHAMCHADVSIIAQRLKQNFPEAYSGLAGLDATADDLRTELTREARPLLFVLAGGAAFVLLIACANVANLILARMSRREAELMIRTAVGAGAGRLLRQLLTESSILAVLGAGIGLVFAAGSMKLLTQFAAPLTPRAREIAMNGWVLAFAILCASATTILFGSMAALYSRQDISSGLKENARAGDRGRHLLRGMLIAAQVAFSFVLLAGAGLLVRSFSQLQRVDPGFIPERVLIAGVDVSFTKYSEAGNRALARRLLDKIQSLPGVLSTAVADSFPLDPDNTPSMRPAHFQVEGDPRPESESPPVTAIRVVSPAYFQTLGIPLVSGRTFRDADQEKSTQVVIINRALALKRWGLADPVGKRIKLTGDQWLQIAGVVGDVKEFGLDRDTPYQVYGVFAQNPYLDAIVVRTSADPVALEQQLRRAVHEVDAEIAVTGISTMEQVRAGSVSSSRTIMRLFSLFAALAFLIAAGGIASMLALWVRQRTREIGIRMALGAGPMSIVYGVVRQGMAYVLLGFVAGIGAALLLTTSLKNLLFQVQPTDVVTFVGASALLLAAALLACLAPARRAARIDPQTALRSE
jgi:putative ABC transport system permease protein